MCVVLSSSYKRLKAQLHVTGPALLTRNGDSPLLKWYVTVLLRSEVFPHSSWEVSNGHGARHPDKHEIQDDSRFVT